MLRSNIVVANFEDGGILHDGRSGRLFVLNPWAKVALEVLRDGGGDGEVVEEIVRHGSIDRATAALDLQSFIESLKQEGLLRFSEARADPSVESPRPPESRPALAATYRMGSRAIRVICHPEDIAHAFAPLAAPSQVADHVPAEIGLTLFRCGQDFVLLENDLEIDRVSSAQSARWALVRELVGEGRGRPWLALLHASAVLTPQGSVLLCGESGSGKSVLLAGLVHAGFPLIADDIALFEQGTGMIWPTPLAISIKEGGWPLVERLFPQLADSPIVHFGMRTMRHLFPDPASVAADAGHPIAAVLFVRYTQGATTACTSLTASDSLQRLGQGGSILPGNDEGFQEFLERWQRTPTWQLTYGTLDDAIRHVRALTSSHGKFAAATV